MLILKTLELISRCCKKNHPPTYRFFCTPTLCLHPFSAASTEESIVPIFMRNRDAYGENHHPGRSWPRCDKKVTLLKVPAVCEGIFTLRVMWRQLFRFLLRRYISFHEVDVGAPGEICLSGFFACWSTHSADCDWLAKSVWHPTVRLVYIQMVEMRPIEGHILLHLKRSKKWQRKTLTPWNEWT